jgi:lipopolysaccharide/colanic/teichoic acid biosynthesis glycosyltransferase
VSTIGTEATLSRTSNVKSRFMTYDCIKRLIDLLGAAAALLLLAPIMAVLAAVVKLTSPGPVLFTHTRLGRGGAEFRCYKFRTMVADAEDVLARSPELQAKFEVNFKLARDPRLTSVGAFLRRTSLDELPQFYNVLNGTMSLIGPRPIVPRERAKYGPCIDRLLSVKPGLGGAWQAYGRSNTTYEQRIALDMYYIDNRSLLLDLKIILLTTLVVLLGHGAC